VDYELSENKRSCNEPLRAVEEAQAVTAIRTSGSGKHRTGQVSPTPRELPRAHKTVYRKFSKVEGDSTTMLPDDHFGFSGVIAFGARVRITRPRMGSSFARPFPLSSNRHQL